MLHVTRAMHVADYRVRLWFNDGTVGEADLSDELDGEVFEVLRDPAYFTEFQLEGHTLSWSNGADFAPEFLLELVQSAASSLR